MSSRSFLAFLILVVSSVILSAQTPEHPNGIGVRFLFLDHFTPNIADKGEPQQLTNGVELSLKRNLGNRYLNVVLPLKFAVAKFPGEATETRFASADLLLEAALFNPDNLVSPYLFAGGGFVMEDFEKYNVQFPVGLGTNMRLSRGFFLNFQVEYRKSLEKGRDNLQYGAGFLFIPGLRKKPMPVDTDGDGIFDSDDLCPTLAGTLPCKGCPDMDNDNIADHLDLCPEFAGTVATSGCPDGDADGIADRDDECPEIAGLAAFNGCPDTDGDGVPDKSDMCPEVSGPSDTQGCPDTDRDGVLDKDDKCPDVAGVVALSGCPEEVPAKSSVPEEVIMQPEAQKPVQEKKIQPAPPAAKQVPSETKKVRTPEKQAEPSKKEPTKVEKTNEPAREPDRDGDGVPDSKDACPDLFGETRYAGCPKPVTSEEDQKEEADLQTDRDEDGVPDYLDRCPLSPGPAGNEGCPVISAEDRSVLDLAMRAIQFESGSAIILAKSYHTLDKVAEVMLKYPDYYLIINGHTDNVGSTRVNQALSEKRARACYNYLVSRGVKSKRMIYAGFGGDKPLTSNRKEEGRAINRRVEFIMYLK